MNAVRVGKFSFDDSDWDPVSNQAKEYVTRLLTYDPKNRPSAKEAFNDPWIQNNTYSNELSSHVMKNITSFNVFFFCLF